jgi:hypothetical protein
MTETAAHGFNAKRCGLTLLLISALYWFCLQFVFPGFFAPTDPLHSDYYLAPALVADAEPIWQKMDYPRPLGFLALWLFGHLGLQGATALIIGLSLINATLTVELWRRMAPRPVAMIGWVPVVIYAALLFGHPQFYLNHAHDAMAALSLLYLLLAMHAWESWKQSGRVGWALLTIPLLLLLVLTKETYFLAALAYWSVQVLMASRERRRTAVIFLVVVLVLELGGALVSLGAREGFVQPSRDASHPYFVNVSPDSILSSLATLLSYQLPLASALVLALALAVAFRRRELRWPALFFLVAGISALLPHSLLPNHLEPNYGWVGATLTFSPLLLLGASDFKHCWARRAVLGGAALLIVAGWTLDRGPYEAGRWQVDQQRTLGNIIDSFELLRRAPPGAKEILITGLKSPFSPFYVPAYENYVAWELGRKRRWTVVMERLGPRGGENLVRRVGLDEVNLADFDHAFAFHTDGTLASAYQRTHLRKAETDPLFRDRILIPDLAIVLKDLENEPGKWYHHLKAGTIYWDWGLAGRARSHFENAAALDESGNPYPPYYLGQTDEAQGNFEEAMRHYRMAVEGEAESPNPSFRESLDRVTAKLGPS